MFAKVLKYGTAIYIAQAVAGAAIGFTYPWLVWAGVL